MVNDLDTIVTLLMAAVAVVLIAYGCRWLNDYLDERAERDMARHRSEFLEKGDRPQDQAR